MRILKEIAIITTEEGNVTLQFKIDDRVFDVEAEVTEGIPTTLNFVDAGEVYGISEAALKRAMI